MVVQNFRVLRLGAVLHNSVHLLRQGMSQLMGLALTEHLGEITLRVNIHQQNFLPLHSQTDAQIFTGGGFARAAFLVDNGYRCCLFGNFHHLRAAKSWLTLF